MPVAFRETLEQILIEGELGRGIDRIEAVFLVSQPAQHQAPAAAAVFKKIVEPPGADHVANDAIDRSALRNGHLGLCDGAAARDIDRAAAEKMQDAHAACPALLIGLDKFFEAA